MAPPAKQAEIRIIPISFADEVGSGDDVADKLITALANLRLVPVAGDILVVKHKIISKAEGRFVALENVRPSAQSRLWAKRYKLDARVVQVALAESKRIVRRKNGVLITETHHGFICANSGVDVSNVDGGENALLLPEDADKSAAQINRRLKKHYRLHIPVLITDTFGRPWREGLTEVAIGVAGMLAVRDYRGQVDSHGHPLRVSIEAVADEIACAAGLVCGKLERVPACIIRGYRYVKGDGSSKDLLRPATADLFR